jgi:hypothetical protein
MVYMSDPTADVVITCFRTVFSDEPWRDIGFAKRPRYGAFFQRFRSAWRTDLEKRTIQEMLATLTAAHVLAGRVSLDDIPTIIAAYTARPDVATALGYSSREESTRHLSQTIAQYCKTPIGDWAGVIAKRLAPASIPDKALSASLLVGCVRFSQNLGSMVLVLRRDRPEARTP